MHQDWSEMVIWLLKSEYRADGDIEGLAGSEIAI